LSGTGKSTLATHISNRLGCELLQTDVIRQQLYGTSDRPAAFEGGHYSQEARRRVYAEMFNRVRPLLQNRVSVVLDGTFSKSNALHKANEMASDYGAVFLAVQCICDRATACRRMDMRATEGPGVTEMRSQLYEQQAINWERWPVQIPQCRIDTQQPVETQVARVLADLQSRPWTID
jgi:predicted kinase